MKDSLREETEKLSRSWMRHDSTWLRDYLVASVEDPRINLQSILTRHFLIRETCGEGFGPLMREEYKFSAAMNWLRDQKEKGATEEDFATIEFALDRGSDNAEGIEIPGWLNKSYSSLPAKANDIEIPNHVRTFLEANSASPANKAAGLQIWNTFAELWERTLKTVVQRKKPKVLEPACGSANDYRFLHAYGVANLIDYTGFDLCEKNVQNARSLFPDVKFEVGNVFAIEAADHSFDYCVVHDLFEHLSPEGLAVAVAEICRVTRQGICAGFFQMDEVPEHITRLVDEYYWNLLSMERMKQAFEASGFSASVIHVGTFLQENTGCTRTHNPDAYTFDLRFKG